jgi:pimeloyl-ACP methyl ester carboxylesterase
MHPINRLIAGKNLTVLALAAGILIAAIPNARADYTPQQTETQQTAKTQFIEAKGVRYAYRRFGKATGIPLVFLIHIRGTMDDWDPAVVNGFARDRPVILFSNAGLGLSGGETADTIAGMAAHVTNFLDGLNLTKVDLLGFSIGGFVAQQVTLDRPDLIHRLILAGTSPQGGVNTQGFSPETAKHAGIANPKIEDRLYLFFGQSESSMKAGWEFAKRWKERNADLEPPVTMAQYQRQLKAGIAWGVKQETPYARLKEIKQPVLIVNGSHDVMLDSVNSYVMYQNIANAKLIMYPDSGHAALFQYADQFVEDATRFLNTPDH